MCFCGLTLNTCPKLFASLSLYTLQNLWYMLRFLISTCPIFLQTMPKLNNSCIPFLNVLTHNKTTFYQSCFHHNYFNLDKSRPFFLCRYYLSTLSEDKEKYILIRERGVVIQLFAMHIHIMCVMQ